VSADSASGDPLAPFTPRVRGWFEASFEGPTPAQTGGWEAISSGENTLICAPTGSGKTLASFLWGIDRLAREPENASLVQHVEEMKRLKALRRRKPATTPESPAPEPAPVTPNTQQPS